MKPFDCTSCLQSFSTKNDLIKHVKNCVEIEKKDIYGGDYTVIATGDNENDNKNMIKSSGEDPHYAKYKIKPELFTETEDEDDARDYEAQKAKLAEILRKETSKETNRKMRKSRLKCPNCPLTFNNVCHLKIHFRKYTGEKPFRCPVCQRGFARNSNLNSHIRTHTGEKRYKCPYCDRKVDHKSALKVHIRVHTGEKPYRLVRFILYLYKHIIITIY